MDLTEKWKKFVSDMNAKGVPLPTLRDPKTGIGSVSLTLVFVSFNLCVAGIIGKWAGALGGIDIQAAFQLFMASGALYWGRKMQKDDKGGIVLEAKDKED